jgi:GNAT superfamily N-acetyltransferase
MSFFDSKGRILDINGDYDVEAFHNGRRVGSIEFDDRDGCTILLAMNVEREYQLAGIGTEMMRHAATLHGKLFGKPRFDAIGGRGASSESYYTQEGAALIARCIRERILEDTDHSECDDYEDD